MRACADVGSTRTGYLFTVLLTFSSICWIKPQDVVINQLFGVSSGLGMGILTFHWVQIM